MESALNDLPDHILISIFINVKSCSLKELENLTLVCRRWCSLVEDSMDIWRTVWLDFDSSYHGQNYKNAVDKFGSRIENVIFRIDQSSIDNRRNSSELLKSLAVVDSRKLQRLIVCFTGENPLFYGGQEFVEALHALFGSAQKTNITIHKTFASIDLCKLPVKYTDELFYSLAANHCETLTYLNIQNRQLICQITCSCLETLTDKCRSLTDLRISHSSASDILLSNLSEPNRQRLTHLSLHCRRQEKYTGIDLSEEAWLRFSAANPNVKVTLRFDHSCTVKKMLEIMKPCIPVYFLFLECYSTPLDVFNIGDFYRSTLTKFVLQAKSHPDYDAVLIDVAKMCPRLKYLHVMFLLEEATVREIFQIRPAVARMAQSGKCTLKFTQQPHPWLTEDILDEIPLKGGCDEL